MTVFRLAGRCRGVPQAPNRSPQVAGTGSRRSAGVGDGGDPLPGPDDRLSPWPVRGNLPASAASAADQAADVVQDAVAQRLRLGSGEIAVQGDQLEPAEQDLRGHRGGHPGLVDDLELVRREAADPGVLPGADGVFDPGMDPMGGSQCIGILPPPAFCVSGRLVTHSW